MIPSRSSRMNAFRIAVAALVIAAVPGVAFASGPRIAVDVATGRVIEHKDAFQRWYPASLTKLMTAYVTFRAIEAGKIDLDTPISMTEEAANQPASKMYFKPGVRFTLDSALKYLIVKSANDIAVAIAQKVGGSVSGFVAMMNAEAARLGMDSTHFINPNGLPGEGQYTTARDLAILAVALKRDFPQFASYFSIEGFSIGKREFHNYNILVGRFDGADGMKTGYICASGFNQVSSASRDGRSVVTVVLGEDSLEKRAEESARLLHEALSSNAAGPTLAALQPYGEGRDKVRDISGEICTAEARKTRSEGRDNNGKMVLRSPYIGPEPKVFHIVPAPVGIAIGDGEATATEAAIVLGTRTIPVPKPRPTL